MIGIMKQMTSQGVEENCDFEFDILDRKVSRNSCKEGIQDDVINIRDGRIKINENIDIGHKSKILGNDTKDDVTIVYKKVSELKPYPKSTDFFTDLTVEEWDRFTRSIKDNGVLNPILISDMDEIIDGIQRFYAAKDVREDIIPCRVKKYSNEDEKIIDMIESNIEQRAKVTLNPMRFSRFTEKLEELYHVCKHGGARYKNGFSKKNGIKTQKELAHKFKMSQQYYHRLKRLNQLIRVLQNSVEEGLLSVYKASLIANLSKVIQEDLLRKHPTEVLIEMKCKEFRAILKSFREET